MKMRVENSKSAYTEKSVISTFQIIVSIFLVISLLIWRAADKNGFSRLFDYYGKYCSGEIRLFNFDKRENEFIEVISELFSDD